jgi:hypothetical protein
VAGYDTLATESQKKSAKDEAAKINGPQMRENPVIADWVPISGGSTEG